MSKSCAKCVCVCVLQVYSLIFGSSLGDGGGAQSWIQGKKNTRQKPGDKVFHLEVGSYSQTHTSTHTCTHAVPRITTPRCSSWERWRLLAGLLLLTAVNYNTNCNNHGNILEVKELSGLSCFFFFYYSKWNYSKWKMFPSSPWQSKHCFKITYPFKHAQ